MTFFPVRRKRWAYAAAACAAAVALFVLLPGTGALRRVPYSLVVEDRDGTLLGAGAARDGQWRFPRQDTVCGKFARAIVVREDRRFWYHPGVDPIALARAVVQNLRARRVVSGGSTISMQVVRLSRPGKRRDVFEKLFEAVLAFKLDLLCGKASVLALYAAHAPFGGNVVGLEAAAWRYFNRPPYRLSWAEAAMLAVLPNEPGLVHPGRNRARLKMKRDRLLGDLHTRGIIDSRDLSLAVAEPLPIEVHSLPRLAPQLFARISQERRTASRLRERTPTGVQTSRVRTTIDAALQQQVNGILARHGRELRANGIFNGAALVLDVASGEVLAYAGNVPSAGDSMREGQVDCIVAPRSTGSVLKPFLYAAMLDCGELLPGMLVPDIPTSIGGFMPQNFNREYEGAVPASMALARSLNVPAVRMLTRHGIPRFYHTLRSLGMSTVNRGADDYGISLILGGAEGTLWELTGIYASMARCVNDATDPDPHRAIAQPHMPVYAHARGDHAPRDAGELPFSAAACWCALDAMKEVGRPGDDLGWKDFQSSRRVAWKTGTSFGFRDGWALGVTPRYTVGVWVGNASGEGRPGLIGIATAAPILFDIFSVLPSTGWFQMPEASMKRVAVCRQSGYLPGLSCEGADTVWSPLTAQSPPVCPYHTIVHLDGQGKYRVTDRCERVDAMIHRSWFVLPPVMESYYRQRHSSYLPLPSMRQDCGSGPNDNPMGLIYPHANAVVYVPRELSGEIGRVVFQATHRTAEKTIFWHLDGDYMGATTVLHQMAFNPPPGRHVLVLVDADGNRIEQQFEALFLDPARR